MKMLWGKKDLIHRDPAGLRKPCKALIKTSPCSALETLLTTDVDEAREHSKESLFTKPLDKLNPKP